MTVIIAAGGTGGHLYPAIALAREFLRCNPAAKILFVGTERGIESKVLAHEGFELVFITAKPVMGKGLRGILSGLLCLPMGIQQSLAILRLHCADLVIGVGGYTSPAVLVAAALKGVPRAILEPNAYPGMANTVVAPFAQRIFLAFEAASASFDRRKVRVVGIPIRQEFLRSTRQSEESATTSGVHLLIFGGSQGAQAINSAVLDGLAVLHARFPDLSITHQTGELDHARVSQAYRALGIQADVAPFFYNMPALLRKADLVVARAGAMTIAELAASGKPAILIPLPTAIYGHQAKNAQEMEEAGGAVVLPQSELNGMRLSEVIGTILQDPQRLDRMRAKSWAMRQVDAGEAIVRECYSLMGVTYDGNRTVGTTGA